MAPDRLIQIIFTAAIPTLCIAQQPAPLPTDCPKWNNKSGNTRSDYLQYLRNNQGKKTSQNSPYYAYTATLGVTDLPATATHKTATRTDFYTKKRYNLFPDKTEQGSQFEPGKEDENKLIPTQKEIVKNVAAPLNNAVAAPAPIAAIDTPTHAIDKNEVVEKNKGEGNAKVESTKTHTSKFKNKIRRLLVKKNNKPAKPNYEKCTTRF